MATQRNGDFYAAVYGIIKNDSGDFLMQRRLNTGFNDGILQFPSGHIEGEETYFQALHREMKEEINIDFTESDVKLSHVLHRVSQGGRVYYDVFLEIQNHCGEIKNREPNKCSELGFFDINNTDITPYNKKVVENIERGIQISEILM